jgi:Zn-dependent alcohol dehydrogenase
VAIEIAAAVVEAQDKPFELQTLEIDERGPGGVLVRLVATWVCHTDGLARHGDLPFPFSGVLGHEGAGIVETVGPGVTEFAAGDRVVIGWPSCGTCRNCQSGSLATANTSANCWPVALDVVVHPPCTARTDRRSRVTSSGSRRSPCMR